MAGQQDNFPLQGNPGAHSGPACREWKTRTDPTGTDTMIRRREASMERKGEDVSEGGG